METESAIKLLVEKYQCFVARDAVFPDVFYYDPMIINIRKPVSIVILAVEDCVTRECQSERCCVQHAHHLRKHVKGNV